MLHRIGRYHEHSNMFKTSILWPKFNDALNDAVAKIDQYILTVNSCGAYEHYDSQRRLSIAGKRNFWMEIDELIQKFDLDKIKLRPNPKNPPRRFQMRAGTTNHPSQQARHHDNNGNWEYLTPNASAALQQRRPTQHGTDWERSWISTVF